MKKVLIVVDMQKDFVDGSLGTKEAVLIVPNVCKKIKEFDGDIYVTYDTHQDNYLETSEGHKLPVVHCVEGSEGWKLNKEVEEALANKEYTTVIKPTFGSIKLPELLKERYSEDLEIELIGLCTDICVVSNALMLKANFYESKISVDSSCCAGVTVDTHNAALTTMKMCQIDAY